MPNINPVEMSEASSDQQKLFNAVNGAFGVVPNMFKTIGHSAPALESMWTSFGALAKGAITPALGAQIAVMVANLNRCEDCLSAHTALGQNAGLSVETLAIAQRGISEDEKTQAALTFAKKLVIQQGQVDKKDIEQVREGGFSDAEISEILAHVALNIFTNYTNVAFDVEVDFPKVALILI